MTRTDLWSLAVVLGVMLTRYTVWFVEHGKSLLHIKTSKPRVITVDTTHDELEEILNIVIPKTSDYPKFFGLEVLDANHGQISSVQSVDLNTGEIVVYLHSIAGLHALDRNRLGELKPIAIRMTLNHLAISVHGKIEFSQTWHRTQTATWEEV